MKTLIKILTLMLSTFLFNTQTTLAQCHINDWTALKALYESTGGDSWTTRFGWDVFIDNQNSPPPNCDLNALYGVTSDFNGRVICIDLDGDYDCATNNTSQVYYGNNLAGALPVEIGNLSQLKWLFLSSNQISSIPNSIENLNNLIKLNLKKNDLSGSIPLELFNLTNLEELHLDRNNLSGSLSPQLSNLSDLTHLYLNDNNLNGSIPPEIGSLTKLVKLQFYNNQFSGLIPTELGNLSDLDLLNLGYNNLIGSIPTSITNLSNLTYLSLSGNDLGGSIPSNIGNLNNLEYLYLANNQFTFIIPPQLGNLTNLMYLWLGGNNLSGSIPTELGNLTNLKELRMSSNQLGGGIPSTFCNLTNLTTLDLWGNLLVGSIPACFGNFINLRYLYLSKNLFNGTLPVEFCNLDMLITLWVNDNELTGSYPDCYFDFCTQLSNSDNGNMSDGNNFNSTWEDFCSSSCEGIIGCTDPTACNYNSNATCDDGNCLQNCNNNVYPGDLNHDGIVNNQDVSLSGLFHYHSGISRASEHQNTEWNSYPSQNWGILNNQNKDIKHHDCNGDGVINENDQQAVEDNMGFTWKPYYPPPPTTVSDYQVMLHPIDQIFDGNLVMNVALEKRSGGNLALQGGHFTIDYSDLEADFSNVVLSFLPISWLGTPEDNLWYESTHFATEKKIEVGFTKTNNTNSQGNGVIAQLILVYDNSAAILSGASTASYQFEVSTIGIHQNNGNFIPVENQQLGIDINPNGCDFNLTINENTSFRNIYQSSNNITTNGFVLIGDEQEVAYNANRVRINSGFSVKAGADFKVRSSGCN